MEEGLIYKYQNKINNKIYIGQTIDLKKRMREHKNAAFNEHNKDKNCPIHQAIKKYGLENFEITIIEDHIPLSELDKKEIQWISFYNSYYDGYNATLGGQFSSNFLGKPVEIYDLNGKFLITYSSAKIAAQELQVSYSTLQQVLHGIRPTCKNIQAKYQGDERIITKFKSRQGGTIPIIQIDKQTNQIIREWDSAAQAARELNLDASAITKVLKKKLKSTGGFVWKYKKEVMENEKTL